MFNTTNHKSPWKINGWNLKIIHLERKMIWTKPPSLWCSMRSFSGVYPIWSHYHSTTQLQELYVNFPWLKGRQVAPFLYQMIQAAPMVLGHWTPEKRSLHHPKKGQVESPGIWYDSWVWFEAMQHVYVCGHKFWPHAILGNTRIVFQPEVHRHFRGDFPVLNFGVTLAVVSLRFWNYERDGIFTYMDGRCSW